MTNSVAQLHPFQATREAGREPLKVKDLSLADFGRNEIRLAEYEMPGLMALRKEYAGLQPLAGAKIMGSLHMTVQTAVLPAGLKQLRPVLVVGVAVRVMNGCGHVVLLHALRMHCKHLGPATI